MAVLTGKYTPAGPHDMEGEGIPEAHVRGIDMDYRAPALPGSTRALLPAPFLEDDPHWVSLYWQTWAIVFSKVYDPPEESGFVKFVDEGFSNNIFQWDTCFIMGFLRYATDYLPVHGTLDNFYSKQHEDGFICREINQLTGEDFWPREHLSNVNPPLFPWAEAGFYKVTGNKERVIKVLPALCRYYEWLKANRRHTDGIGYWTTSLSSGMDNTPRAYDAGGMDVHLSYGHVWLCMTVQQALSASMIAYLAEEIGDRETAALYRADYEALATYVNEKLWSEAAGFYFDLDQDGNHVRVKTPASYWPLVAGIASDEQALRAAERIFNPEEFWRPHALPSLSADHELYHPRGNYWQGAVWPPLVYLAVRGLEQTGQHARAVRLATNHLNNLSAVFDATGTLWENYAPEEDRRGNISRPEFAGWTGNGPIAMLIETILGFEVDFPKNEVTWQVTRTDRHGIKRLPFGNHKVSFEYIPTSNSILVDSEVEFRLNVIKDNASFVLPIAEGKQEISLAA